MNKFIIYKPEKSPTQSGTKNTIYWILETDERAFTETDPLTGWKSDNEYKAIIRLKFKTLEEAINYAKNKHYEYKVLEKKKSSLKIKSYSDNFKYKRIKTEI